MESKLIGNKKAVQKAEAYLSGSTYSPLLIRGQEGLGQELLAMEIAAELLRTETPEKHGNFFALREKSCSIEAVFRPIEARKRSSAYSAWVP